MKPNLIQRPAEPREREGDELKAAYEIHTLVQLLTARIAVPSLWAPPIQVPYPPVLH